MNRALHAKWIWRYGKEEKALWRKVVNHKFGGNPKVFFPSSNNKPMRILWASILKSNSTVVQNSVLKVNNGDKVLFWRDIWLNGHAPMMLFPALFKLSRNKDATIQEMLMMSGHDTWNFAFSRLLNDQEIEDVAHLLNLIPAINSDSGGNQ
ncbi:uncharacterized protein LOC113311992 [Papaver somniferum]|uniref:uncharacterized protein LOC113311992 n=1 Tax=Papaver somniferum TaxID=3469 RepID=UPI000E6F7903|nr:uncharacterized protein LOC113311992 [Papaver somniferum]